MKPVPPIFIVDSNDADVAAFSSVDEAEGFMETSDVKRHEYDAYDGLARQLQLEVHGYDVKIAGIAGSREDLFRQRIAWFLAEIGERPEAEDLPLEEFVPKAYSAIAAWQRGRGKRSATE